MEQVFHLIGKVAENPNSGIDGTNLVDTIAKATDTVLNCYRKVDDYLAGTSLTAAEKPAAVIETVVQSAQPIAQPEPQVSAEPAARPATKAGRASVKLGRPRKVSAPVVEEPDVPTVTEPEVQTATTEEPKVETAPVETLDDETLAENFIREQGSAIKAAEHIERTRKRGRKPGWHKIVEERAELELRDAPRKSAIIDEKALAAAMSAGKTKEEASEEQTGYKFAHVPREPVMDPEKALQGPEITCLIDGAKRTMMGRYIWTKYHMTPKEYIAHFNLRADYPMSSKSYRDEKRRLAALQQLGKRKQEVVEAPVTKVAQTARRQRTRKAA